MNNSTEEHLINHLIAIDDTLGTLTDMPVEVLRSIDRTIDNLDTTICRRADELYDRALNTDYILCRIAGALLAALPSKDYAIAEAFAQELYKKAFQAREPK